MFGASGFTGKHVVKEMSRIGRSYPEITWAIAGRDQDKLEAVLQDVSYKTGKIYLIFLMCGIRREI